jgi:hypothetical protein
MTNSAMFSLNHPLERVSVSAIALYLPWICSAQWTRHALAALIKRFEADRLRRNAILIAL